MFKHFKPLLMALLLSVSFIITGCGEQEVEEEDPKTAYLKTLENDSYYIRHVNYTVDKPYFAVATFDYGSVASSNEAQQDVYTEEDNRSLMDNSRVMWFEGNEDHIPVMYEGDSLIYYTTDVLKESFTIERFEDLGYTIGICNMTVNPSGRFSIPTGEQERSTYPNADTDAITSFTNETVILDTLGGKPIRSTTIEETYDDAGQKVQKEESTLTRSGTIKGLERDKVYSAEIYEGTVRHLFDFKCDVFVLAHWDSYFTVDYTFESEKIIRIEIPEYFHTGYYMINGVGVFKYIKTSEVLTDEDIALLGEDSAEEYVAKCIANETLPWVDEKNIDYNVRNINPDAYGHLDLPGQDTNKKTYDIVSDILDTMSGEELYDIDYWELIEKIAAQLNEEEDTPKEPAEDPDKKFYMPKVSDMVVKNPGSYKVTLTLSDYDYAQLDQLSFAVYYESLDLTIYITQATKENGKLVFTIPVYDNMVGTARLIVYNAKYPISTRCDQVSDSPFTEDNEE